MPKIALILGGAASGKSDVAETVVLASGLRPVYIATAQPFDDEMRAKIAAHRAARDATWDTIESPLDLVTPLRAAASDSFVLVDCLTLWLSNLLLAGRDPDAETAALLDALAAAAGRVALVSNEVGQGIVPDNALARRFRNAQGRLNRRLAAVADPVVGVMAGLPFALKGTLPRALA
ncbi:bifunctional adenosylcobinamide kinase/adenosylcobinamide-phosphate guanylyltransferase [Rhodobacteraceae bacterium CCMM004]|nr:bifunctional adenosylcobinamide kinase/adenosylcobinamide-phosphate guanylyltransferase [Rhodobacteraceae bacterium CCMM004]